MLNRLKGTNLTKRLNPKFSLGATTPLKLIEFSNYKMEKFL